VNGTQNLRIRATKKQIAWDAGIDPRTFRRIEKGQRTTDRTRRKVAEALSNSKGDPIDAEEDFRNAQSELMRITTDDRLKTLERCKLFLIVPLFLMWPTIAEILNPSHPAGSRQAGLAVGLYIVLAALIGVAFCMIVTILGGKSVKREIRADAEPSAAIVLEGIRIGAIRHLSPRRYEALSWVVGEREAMKAIRASPERFSTL
jgi:hypothetical protein